MNQQVSLALNVILAIAVAILYYLHFSSPSGAGAPSAVGAAAGDAQIVYVNTDSLINNYEFFADVQKELQEKREKAQKQLAVRSQNFQEEMVSAQRRAQAGLLTPNQEKELTQQLAQKEQEIMAYRETVTAGLMEEEKILNNRLYDSLMSYLKTYNKDKNYRFIFGYSKGGGILLANEGLDITKTVLNGLNDKYKGEKAKNTGGESKEEDKK